jgi:hypothetical protein
MVLRGFISLKLIVFTYNLKHLPPMAYTLDPPHTVRKHVITGYFTENI